MKKASLFFLLIIPFAFSLSLPGRLFADDNNSQGAAVQGTQADGLKGVQKGMLDTHFLRNVKPATFEEYTAARDALTEYVTTEKDNPKNPEAVKTLEGHVNDARLELKKMRMDIVTKQGTDQQQADAYSPEVLGAFTAVSKGLLEVGRGGKDMGVAKDQLMPGKNKKLTPAQIAELQGQLNAGQTQVTGGFDMMPKRTKDGMPDFGGMPGRDGKPDQNESTNPDRQQDPNRPELWATTAGAQRNRLKDFLKDVGYDVSPKPKPQPDPGPSPQPGPNNPVNPITPDLNVVIGNNKAQAGDFSGAEHSFTDALDSDPSNIDALNGRGQVRLRMGDNLGAADDARAVLGQDSGNGTARETLRYATKQLGDEMNAPKAANPWEGQNGGQAAQLAGGQLRIFGAGRGARSPLEAESALLSQQAWQLLRVRDYDRARGLLDRALALDAGNPDALTRRAALNIATGRYGEALRDALAALEASPARARGPAKQIASEFARRGHYKESKALALALLRQDPKDASAHFALARAEYGLGNRAATLQQLQEAASLDPAAYRAKFEAARAAGNDEDLTFLFDDAAGTQPQGGASARQPASRGRGFWWTVVATLVGGLLVALGLLHAAGAPVAERLTTGFRSLTGAGAEPEAADGAPAVEAERAPPDGDITVAGRVIGNYELVRQIGLGGMGIVYEAMDRSLGRRVAVKKMREEIRVDPRERERFLKEARTVAGLKHPSIVEIHAVVEDSDDVYLVFEYVSGTTLYELLDRRGKLGLAEAAGLVEKIGKALVYAHARGVIHRDLKPSNVMLDEEGTVKVMDFGVARQAKDAATKLSMTGTVVGTPPYMAPEQEQGMVCRESDVYALAVCFYELITGRLPFQGSGAGMLLSKMNKTYAPASTLAPELPAAVDELMAKALEPEPTKRFRTVVDFVEAVHQVAAAR